MQRVPQLGDRERLHEPRDMTEVPLGDFIASHGHEGDVPIREDLCDRQRAVQAKLKHRAGRHRGLPSKRWPSPRLEELFVNRLRIDALAVGARLPTMFGVRDFVEAGGLMSYGANFPDLWRRGNELSTAFCAARSPAT